MQHAVEKPSKYEFLWEENVNSANWKCLGSDHNNSEQQQGHFKWKRKKYHFHTVLCKSDSSKPRMSMKLSDFYLYAATKLKL